MGFMKAQAVRRVLTGSKAGIHPGMLYDGPVEAICSYCGKSIAGSSINGLHLKCNDKLSEEMHAWEQMCQPMVLEE